MKFYAYVNKNANRELKVHKYEDTARERAFNGRVIEVENGFHKETPNDGKENPDGTYVAEQINGNIIVNGKEIFADKDGIRINSASAETISFDSKSFPKEYEEVKVLYERLTV